MRPGPIGVVNSLVHKACLDLDITHSRKACAIWRHSRPREFRFIGLPLKWRRRDGLADPCRGRFDE